MSDEHGLREANKGLARRLDDVYECLPTLKANIRKRCLEGSAVTSADFQAALREAIKEVQRPIVLPIE